MKIQLKRSNVLDGGVAKQPTASQMEYGEVAVNYSDTDPVLFIKDSNDAIVRIAGAGSSGSFDGNYNNLTNKPTIGDGTLTINNSNGSAAGTFTANQVGDTTILLPEGFSGSWNDLTDVPGSITGDYNDLINQPTIGDGSITINQGGTAVATFTVNQTGDTVVNLSEGAIYTAEVGKGIAINASDEISIGDDWSAIPALV